MPIRLNLLAEAQAAEELRRKDPVKRAMMLGAACVVLMALASLLLQSQILSTNHEDKSYITRIGAITNDYSEVVKDNERLKRAMLHRRGLDILSSERILYGNMLNALQKVYVDDVQLLHVRTEHTFEQFEPVVDKKDASKPSKAATATERILIVLEARDSSRNPGDKVSEFKQAVNGNTYFASMLGENSNLVLANMSAPQPIGGAGALAVQFSLQARLPEKIRLGISSAARYAAPSAPAKTVRPKPTGPVQL